MNPSVEENSCFNVNFGIGVGMFQLGTHINDLLKLFSKEYPRLTLEVLFSDQVNVSIADIQINIPQWGIRLRFQPLSQRLYLIDVHDFHAAIGFNINGHVIRDHKHATTFSNLQKALGPIFPGRFVDEGQYLVTFSGAGLMFLVPLKYQELYRDGRTLPIVLPDKSSAVLQRIYIFAKDFDMQHPERYPDTLLAKCRIILQQQQSPQTPGTHIQFISPPSSQDSQRGDQREHLPTPSPPLANTLSLGMGPQDVVSLLGTPEFSSLSSQHADPFVHKYEYSHLGKHNWTNATHCMSCVACV